MKFWVEEAFAFLTLLNFKGKSVLTSYRRTGVANFGPLQLHNSYIKNVLGITGTERSPTT